MIVKLLPWLLFTSLVACTAGTPSCSDASTIEVASAQAAQGAPAPDIAPEQQEPQPNDVIADNPAANNDEIESLLDKLEKSASDLQAFTADVIYDKEDAILGRRERRTGELFYRRDSQNNRKSFAVLFDSVIIGNTKRNDNKHFIFDGRWLAEINHKEKQFIKREIVAPGKELDPLKLGEGPFPLPIGQPKSEVLARFDVTATSPPQQGLLKDLQNVDGLSLTPKPNSREARDFERVDLFYDRQTMLPVGIVTIETNDDIKTIRLNQVKRNPQLDQAALKKLDIQEPNPREWRIDVRPWNAGE